MRISRLKAINALLIVLAIASPVAFTPTDGFEANDACSQNGTCCNSNDGCVVNGQVIDDGWWDATGQCKRDVE